MITVKHILEMAKRMKSPSSHVLDDVDTRKKLFTVHSNSPIIHYDTGTPAIKVHKITIGVGKKALTTITTNDHDKKETLHHAQIRTNENLIPGVTTDEQVSVERKRGEDLPKGHATNVIYHHFEHSKHPLQTSVLQYDKGHDMWHRLVHKALDEGHRVYHWDGVKLHKTTKENANEHLQNSFGNSNDHYDKHMILSKAELEDK